MNHYNTIEVDIQQRIATIWLSRAEKRNAINRQVIDELSAALDIAETDDHVRVVVLRGRGDFFCAGGDLKWMSSGADLPIEVQPPSLLAALFAKLYRFPKPLVVVVHGAALGGALGLIASADYVIAESHAVLSFTELRLGLIPAVISPFVIKRIGEYRARRLMLSAKQLTAAEALHQELVDAVLEMVDIPRYLEDLCSAIQKNAPKATVACKKLITKVSGSEMNNALFLYTAGQLSEIQQKDEAREGIEAFFNKRSASWADNDKENL